MGRGTRAATPPTGRERLPFLQGLGRGQRGAPCSRHPWSRRRQLRGRNRATVGGWAATLSAAGMRWKPPSPFPGESPKGRSGAWLGRRLLGSASEGAARLLSPAVPTRRGERVPHSDPAKRVASGFIALPRPHLVVPQIPPSPTPFHGLCNYLGLGPITLTHQNSQAETPPGP